MGNRPQAARALLVADGEAVWFWRPEAGVKFARRQRVARMTGSTKRWSPGRARNKLKNHSRAGMPDVFRCLRCEYSCAYLNYPSAHEAAGALGTRHSPRPLIGEGERFRQNPGRVAPRRPNVCLQIARDGAAFSTVIVRLVRNCALERTIQYSGDISGRNDTPRRTGCPACAGHDGGTYCVITSSIPSS